MYNSRFWGAAVAMLLLSACGSGHVSPKYEPYTEPSAGCDERGAGPENLVSPVMRTFASGHLLPERLTDSVQTYRLFIDGIPHCTRRVLWRNGQPSRSPVVAPVTENPMWFSADDTIALLSQEAGYPLELQAIPEACWYEFEGVLHPAWMLEGRISGEPKRWFASGDTTYREDTVAFFLEGTASIYESSPGSPRIDVPLPELDGSGFLRSPRFLTDIPDDFPRARASAPDFRFDYDPLDVRFNEVSVFANAERMAAFLQREEFGYNMDCLPIHLRVPDRVQQEGVWKPINNAAYIPASFNSEGSFALIRIGEGDGIGLQGLTQDADVIFHELGHHVVFRTLKSTAYESRLIHEALADYFLFAKTGNSCVGEGICPQGSEDCWQAACLRNGDNDMKFSDKELPSGYHQRSQILSGMMWDLRQDVGAGAVNRIAFKSVDYLLWESDYEDFIYALMAADQDLYEGRNACTIYQAAIARGLQNRLKDLECADFQGNALDVSADP